MKLLPLYYLKQSLLYRFVYLLYNQLLECQFIQNSLTAKIAGNFRAVIRFGQKLWCNSNVTINNQVDLWLDSISWFIDHNLKYLEPLLVIVVFLMLIVYIVVAYVIGIPYWYHRSPLILLIAFVIGHWLLINVSWNYFKALCTGPGSPSDRLVIPESLSRCKKCFLPKPARTHHCSVCNRCILKMDHHCPWLNNCIGHFNHRYFIFFCVYTWLGTVFVMFFGVLTFVDHFMPTFTPFESSIFYQEVDYYIDSLYIIFDLFEIRSSKIRHKFIIYEAIISVLLFILLGLLLRYHFILITNGETCIERHINENEREKFRRQNRHYRNPYDFGVKENWRRFLGFDRNRNNPWRHILLPSNFPPIGDGFSWNTSF